MASAPPLWLLKLLEWESLRWDDLPEELQMALPYCPLEVAREVIRMFKERLDELDEEVSGSLTYLELLERIMPKKHEA